MMGNWVGCPEIFYVDFWHLEETKVPKAKAEPGRVGSFAQDLLYWELEFGFRLFLKEQGPECKTVDWLGICYIVIQ